MNQEKTNKPYVPPFVRRAMKDATEEEILEATERLRRYLKAMYAIFLEYEAQKAQSESVL